MPSNWYRKRTRLARFRLTALESISRFFVRAASLAFVAALKVFPSAIARTMETGGAGVLRLGSSASTHTAPDRKPNQMRPSGDETAVGKGRMRCGTLGK